MQIGGYNNNYFYNKPTVRVQNDVPSNTEENLNLPEVKPETPENEVEIQTCGLSPEEKSALLIRRMRQAIIRGEGEEWARLMNFNFVEKDPTWGGLLPGGASVQNPKGLA